MARKSKEIQGERIMKYYIIVGWDKESKKMLYYGGGKWWQFVTGAEIFFDDVYAPVEYDENIERRFKMQVNFGKVEEIK